MRSLLIPFLRWLRVDDCPNVRALSITEQQIPGRVGDDADDIDAKGLPDAAIFNDTSLDNLYLAGFADEHDLDFKTNNNFNLVGLHAMAQRAASFAVKASFHKPRGHIAALERYDEMMLNYRNNII